MRIKIFSAGLSLRSLAFGAVLSVASLGVAVAQPQIQIQFKNTKVYAGTGATGGQVATGGQSATVEVYARAGANYVTQDGSITNANGSWSNIQIRFDVSTASLTATLPTGSITFTRNTLATTSSSAQTNIPVPTPPAVANPLLDGGILVVNSNNSAGDFNADHLTYTYLGLITMTFTGGTVDATDLITPRASDASILPNPTSFWSTNGAPGVQNALSLPGATPLPVQLVDFSAHKAADGQRVQLDWVTASETGTDYFEVERSSGEGGVYASIGVRVKGAGSSSTRLDYLSYDRSPLAGMNWYRLRMVDLSGGVSYSAAKSVRFEGAGSESVSLYPNPLRRGDGGSVHLQVQASTDQSVSYSIMDGLGKLVGGGSVEVSRGSGAYPVEGLESLSAGTYYLSAKGATIKANLKFTKTE